MNDVFARIRIVPDISVADVIDASFSKALVSGLNTFNDEAAGISDRRPLAVIAKEAGTEQVLGGAIGRSSRGLLSLDVFYLPKAFRGSGLGARILNEFEDEGRRRGCRSAVLYTFSFQAPDFYARNGWRRFGEIACNPPGTSQIFMTKEL
jgi:GNAT superfamily N-acetyltransferase